MLPDLKEIRLASLSDVLYSFHVGNHPGKSYDETVLVIRFAGTYRIGSAGNPDATFMSAMGNAGVEAFDPDVIVIDLSDLTYEWGDMLEMVFSIGDTLNRPSAVVVAEGCRAAIGTLCFGVNSEKDACEQEWIFDSLEAAWNYVTTLLDEGERPKIHEAASNADLDDVKELLEAGEKPNRLDSSGQSPLHCTSDARIIELLLNAGADPKAKNRHGVTPLHLVENVEAARMLLKAGADPDARSGTDSSPLSHAQSVDLVRLLIDAGADVNLRQRHSLLHYVRQPDIARVLIESGADVNMVDENGKTPLDRAEESERQFQRQFQDCGRAVDAEVAQRYSEMASLIRASGGQHGAEVIATRRRLNA